MRKKVSNLATIRIIGISMLFLALAPKSVYAYELDTHYQLTYVMCRAAGLNHNDALTVAQCDQGMDDSQGTLANCGPLGAVPNPTEEVLWHALPSEGPWNPTGNLRIALPPGFFWHPTLNLPFTFPWDPLSETLIRKERLFLYALSRSNRQLKLQHLGVFFHYQQDVWAHRVHPNSDSKDFKPYLMPFGHGPMGHQPDRPPFDPVCALRCLEEGIGYVRRFMTLNNETPNTMFDGYSPAEGKLDTNWPKKGKFSNQIIIDKSSKATELTTSLIRAQIDSYTTGLGDVNPHYIGFETSNEAVYGKVRENLQSVCAQLNVSVQIPAYHIPLTTLSTLMVLDGGALPIPPVAGPEIIIRIQSSQNQNFVCATDGLKDNQWLYCKPGTPLTFVVEGPLDNCALRVKGESLFFSYKESTGSIKLWSTAEEAKFSLEKQANGTYAIRSLTYGNYVWLYKESPYLTQAGCANNVNGQWIIEVVSGTLPVTPVQATITLQSNENQNFVCATDGLKDNQWLYCKPGTAVSFVVEGPLNNCRLRVKDQCLYFSYKESTGSMKLWSTPEGANFSLEKQANGTYAIRSLTYNNYVWLYKESPYLTKGGCTNNANAQWNIKVVSGTLPVTPVQATITLQSNQNQNFVCATDGLSDNQWLYCKPGTAVSFVVEGPLNNCRLRVKDQCLYFSYKESTGAIKLLSLPEGANFSLEKQDNGTYAIRSLTYDQYVWLYRQSPYVTSEGRADKAEGQWIISGLEIGTATAPPPTKNVLTAGENLNTGQRITSANGQYYLTLQDFDGNLCIYKTADNGFVWGSMAYGFQGATLKMQTDGNLVVYDGSNAAKWSSKTHPAYDTKFSNNLNVPVKVVLEDTGKLVLYNAAGSAMWSSK